MTTDSNGVEDFVAGRVSLVGIELDDRAIVVRPEPPDDCSTRYQPAETTAQQTPTGITVSALFTHDPAGDCLDIVLIFEPVRIQLDSPLDGRPIFDANHPARPLAAELPAGSVYGNYQITADADAIRGAIADDLRAVLLWHGTESPTRQATWVPLGWLPKPPALTVPIPARGGEAWFGLERQLPTDSGVEQRYPADLDTDVTVPIPHAPGEHILDRHLSIHLGAGAVIIDGNPLRLDPQAITISWT